MKRIKTLLLTLCFLPFIGLAQQCNNLIEVDINLNTPFYHFVTFDTQSPENTQVWQWAIEVNNQYFILRETNTNIFSHFLPPWVWELRVRCRNQCDDGTWNDWTPVAVKNT